MATTHRWTPPGAVQQTCAICGAKLDMRSKGFRYTTPRDPLATRKAPPCLPIPSALDDVIRRSLAAGAR